MCCFLSCSLVSLLAQDVGSAPEKSYQFPPEIEISSGTMEAGVEDARMPVIENSNPKAEVSELDDVVEPPAVSWRERYTLGPGDVVDIRFFGDKELSRGGVRIAPDNTISYLQANSINIGDSTINDLRFVLEEELSKYYRNPRLIISPFELKSKRYTILGKVIDKGVFTLERPITLLEAIAQSRGIEVGLVEGNTVEIADMQRSFVARGGALLNVDFSKLYFEGDLTQNVYLEPQDFIYIAGNDSSGYYVFGAVIQPGPQNLSRDGGIVTAVTVRNGFTDDAWKKKILVVRGSLTEPKTFIIDVDRVLRGLDKDFLIEPGDIVYVNSRPWYRPEQILNRAIETYLESATSSWINVNMKDVIQKPYIKNINWRQEDTP